MTWAAPLAIASAFGFGQPSRGATRRSRSRPKFHMARAAAPMFSPICGLTRTKAGPSPVAVASLVVLTSGSRLDGPAWYAGPSRTASASLAERRAAQLAGHVGAGQADVTQ